ncbi:fungal-specific transcription factor domain-containing protein, partial [Delphinella strobiligena]
YFANMTAFSIFHQPSFYDSIQSITSPTDLQALLASMLSFSMRFETSLTSHSPSSRAIENLAGGQGHEYFHHLALELIDIAMKNCRDEAPSLPLLQAIVLTTFYQLTSGVRGRAWRALGLCVRIAYEQRLHLIDANRSDDVTDGPADKTRWYHDEERRRTWWAIWEMDVFASIIRRCPTAIDWRQNKSFLPVTDDAWFSLTYMPSCRLLESPRDRWKALRDCDSKSHWAWFIVVNSFAHDAEYLCSQRAAQKNSPLPNDQSLPSPVADIENQISILGHCLRCLTSALPETLKYHGEHLSF